MLILKIVELGPVHGYGSLSESGRFPRKCCKCNRITLPALHRLEKRGWLAAEWGESEKGRQAKFYKCRRRAKAIGKRRIELNACRAVANILQTLIGVIHVLVEILIPKRASDAQMNSELRFHIDELTDENIAGNAPDEARRRAILEFGGQEKIKEEVATSTASDSSTPLSPISNRLPLHSQISTFSHRDSHLGWVSAQQRCLLRHRRHLLKPSRSRADQLCRRPIQSETSSPLHLVAPVRSRMESPQFHFQALTAIYSEDVSESTGLSERVIAPGSSRSFKSGPFRPFGREFTPTRRLSTGRPRPD